MNQLPHFWRLFFRSRNEKGDEAVLRAEERRRRQADRWQVVMTEVRRVERMSTQPKPRRH